MIAAARSLSLSFLVEMIYDRGDAECLQSLRCDFYKQTPPVATNVGTCQLRQFDLT